MKGLSLIKVCPVYQLTKYYKVKQIGPTPIPFMGELWKVRKIAFAEVRV